LIEHPGVRKPAATERPRLVSRVALG
jgi:hypothetical protein